MVFPPFFLFGFPYLEARARVKKVIARTNTCLQGVQVWSVRRLILGFLMNRIAVQVGIVGVISPPFFGDLGVGTLYLILCMLIMRFLARSVRFQGTKIVSAPYL